MNGDRPVPPDFDAILNRGRMLADGIPFADLREAEDVARAGDEVQWFDFWLDKSRSYEDLATAALAAGDSISGGEWMWHASLSAHYAQFMWFHEPERREAGQRRKVELYDRAAPHFRRPGERIEVPFRTTRIPAYLRLPHEAAHGPVACCVLIGGLESTKEESHLFENLLLERGLATVTFDGPGQGELFFEVKLGTDFDRCTSALVDEVERRPEIDARRIGVLGRSLGGHYAPLSAARDKRFAACCAWGACFDLADLDSMPAHTRAGFVYVTGIDDERAALAHLRASINLAGIAGEIRCPTLVLHGGHDVIFGIDQVEKFRAEVTEAELEVQVEDDGDHCCHNIGHLVRPRMADWMASRLAVAG